MPNRRQIVLGLIGLTGVGAVVGWFKKFLGGPNPAQEQEPSMTMQTFPLGFQWPTQEPFLFCVHHLDLYPKGTENFGPSKQALAGRDLGQDFEGIDGFRMYHGEEVPGFPAHPHRGFETITIVRRGYIDHADSMGAAARYGEGDVQWLTAGAGVQHSEMFPLLKQDQENTAELFQIWLNLPRRSKMVPAHFKMFWSEKIPRLEEDNSRVSITVVAGQYKDRVALAPPPDSWAAQPENDVAIFLVKIKPGGTFNLPKAQAGTRRTLYHFNGSRLSLNGSAVAPNIGVAVDPEFDLELKATGSESELLVLQAKPIGEPTVQHGPFVMNSKQEIVETINDYQRTHFGGWSWPRHDMVHGPKIERFARYPDGKVDKPTQV